MVVIIDSPAVIIQRFPGTFTQLSPMGMSFKTIVQYHNQDIGTDKVKINNGYTA